MGSSALPAPFFAAEDIEQVNGFKIRGLGFPDRMQNRLVRSRLRHQHRHVAADGRELRQRLERFGQIPPREQLIEVQLRQKNGVAQIAYFFASVGDN